MILGLTAPWDGERLPASELVRGQGYTVTGPEAICLSQGHVLSEDEKKERPGIRASLHRTTYDYQSNNQNT